eukprot:NODE_18_length_40692_cov_0.469183.p19 type:complete len:140 gc:universal NODE_18_length_40692_cov_0.469183:25232-25651(+)
MLAIYSFAYGQRYTTGDAMEVTPSSGYGYKAPSSGYGYKAPSSGYGYKAPSSGYGHRAPSSGYGYKAPSSGYGYSGSDSDVPNTPVIDYPGTGGDYEDTPEPTEAVPDYEDHEGHEYDQKSSSAAIGTTIVAIIGAYIL